jgi:hypothetical protein
MSVDPSLTAKAIADAGIRMHNVSPQRQREALELLGQGVSRYKVAQRLGIHWQTVVKLAEQAEHRGILRPLKDRMRNKLGVILEKDLDSRMESDEKMQPIEFGVLFDKHALLAGDPTEIVEVKDESADRIADALRRIAGGADAVEVIAEVIEEPGQLTAGVPEVPVELVEAYDSVKVQRPIGRPKGSLDSLPRRPKGTPKHTPRFRRQTP